ncbi:MAG TPA: GNAT family N-acetyltransferase [Gemmatimonadales bacterium]|jgi:ribosomal protein S18 acetylase RimI-like enzyme|nr:GNAT family N-acetyltransferase [Gemmatimonadales bacterium]
MSELIIREIGQDDDFGHWFHELLERDDSESSIGPSDDRYLVLSNEIGDWIGGLRFSLRGGVAQLIEIGISPAERSQGHAHRLLAAFELRATQEDAHLAEFWTDDLGAEGLLSALGWHRVMLRENYLGGRAWLLMEKRLGS